jgi:ATP-dependent Lon protease
MFTNDGRMTDEKMRMARRIQELESEINLLKAENNTIKNELEKTQRESILAEQIKRSLC